MIFCKGNVRDYDVMMILQTLIESSDVDEYTDSIVALFSTTNSA